MDNLHLLQITMTTYKKSLMAHKIDFGEREIDGGEKSLETSAEEE